MAVETMFGLCVRKCLHGIDGWMEELGGSLAKREVGQTLRWWWDFASWRRQVNVGLCLVLVTASKCILMLDRVTDGFDESLWHWRPEQNWTSGLLEVGLVSNLRQCKSAVVGTTWRHSVDTAWRD